MRTAGGLDAAGRKGQASGLDGGLLRACRLGQAGRAKRRVDNRTGNEGRGEGGVRGVGNSGKGSEIWEAMMQTTIMKRMRWRWRLGEIEYERAYGLEDWWLRWE